jgi:choline monooxygenase
MRPEDSLLSQYRYEPDLRRATTLPSSWYTEPAMFELERERVFARTWQPAARLEELRRPGDFVTADVGGEPVVLTRGQDGALRGFYNVCRHRAGNVAAGKGNRKTLQCRYHGCTYSLEGRLTSTPEFEEAEGFSRDEYGLRPVHVSAWGPFAFVNLDPSAPGLETFLGEIMTETGPIAMDAMRMVERRDYVVECNWKVYVDNYLEGYHIPVAHPGLYRELDYENYRVDTRRLHSRQMAPLRPALGGGAPRRYADVRPDDQALYYWVFPNFMINIYPDNLSSNLILPLGPERTLTVFEWFFLEPGSGESWEGVQQAVAFSDEIQKEDIEICEAVQRGLRSRAYDRGRFSPKRENGVHHFHSLLDGYLRKD